jgi:hypothetical protein
MAVIAPDWCLVEETTQETLLRPDPGTGSGDWECRDYYFRESVASAVGFVERVNMSPGGAAPKPRRGRVMHMELL